MSTEVYDYLMVTAEGEYIRVSTYKTMVGCRYEFTTTKDIDKATSLMSVAGSVELRKINSKFPDWKRIPCRITRKVELKTEELNLNLPKE